MREIEVTALAGFVEAHAAQAPVLLDVREPWEVELGTIELPGARTLTWPMGTVPGRLAELDRAQPVVCICHHGMRSAQVVAFLAHHGHQAVYNLVGGTDAWSAQVDPRLRATESGNARVRRPDHPPPPLQKETSSCP